MANHFATMAKELESNEERILNELNAVQGSSVELGGYYHVDRELGDQYMRPSSTLNSIIASAAIMA